MSGVDECEGFICPYCLVSFTHQHQLQQHFTEMHSGQGVVEQDDYDVVEYVEDEVRSSSPQPPPSHSFKMVPISRPRSCDVCSEIIWHESLVCQLCQAVIHTDICEEKLTEPCAGNLNSPTYEGELLPSDRERKSSMSQLGINKGILNMVKTQVSKGRNRYQNEEFDLDLTYITERIIAMSFPATGVVESAYRNNLKDVAKMLKTKHQDNYMVFNLSERSYDISRFNNQVLDFGWPDHLAPSLERLSSVCKSIKSWLDSDPQHVAVVHCKGGKGRTGCVIAAFMHYTEICHSAAAALDRFAMKRFYDNKCGGVTQPSQRKYVHHFADLLAGKIDLTAPPVVLHHVLLHGIPNFDGKGGCRVFIKIYENMSLVHTSGLFTYTAENDRIKISIYEGLQLQGEVLLKCFHKRVHTGMDSVFRCQFPTAIVKDDLRLVYSKSELDDANKDKRFPEIKVELLFREAEGGAKEGESSDIRSSLLDAKQSHTISPTDLTHDKLATRDSYAAFAGGSDDGLDETDDVPDLMGHESPVDLVKRDRTDTTGSFKMKPEDLERVTHQDEVYTVVSKQFKQGLRDDKIRQQKSASNISQDVLKPRPKLRPSKSTDMVDGNGPPPVTKPTRPAVPPHRNRGANYQVVSGGNSSGFGGGGSQYPQLVAGLPSHLPPPQIIQKQRSTDLPLVPPASSSSMAPRPPSAPLLDTRSDLDYEEIDESESPPPQPSGGTSPTVSPVPGRGGNQLGVVKPSQHQQFKKPPSSSDHQSSPEVAKKPVQPRPKPVPAAKPSMDVIRENKKQELHMKYKRIQDEMIKKQEANGAQNSRMRGWGVGGNAGPNVVNSRAAIEAIERREPAVRDREGPSKKLKHRPSYAEVDPEQEITVEEFEGEGEEAALWGLVRYPGMKKDDHNKSAAPAQPSLANGANVAAAIAALSKQHVHQKQPVQSQLPPPHQRSEDSIKRSSSSSNLTGSDFYSNLTDLELDQPVDAAGNSDSLSRKSHSFSEGLDQIVISAANGSRDSIIDISSTPQFTETSPVTDEGNFENPDYKNLQYDEDGTLDLRGGEAVPEPGAHSFFDHIKMLGVSPNNVPPGHSYENTALKDAGGEDYVNDSALGDVHNYTNHDDLLLQLQAENIPQPEEIERALETSQRLRLGSGASIFKLLKTTILKPKQPTEIHSSSMADDQGTSTLAPFSLSGINIGRVNKDYEAFKGSAWVDYSETPATTSVSSESSNLNSSGGASGISKKAFNNRVSEEQLRLAKDEDNSRRPLPSPPHPPISKHRAKTDATALGGGASDVDRPWPPHHSPQSHRKSGVPLPPPPGGKRPPVMTPTTAAAAGGASVGGVGNSVFHRAMPERPSPQNRPLPASPKQNASFFSSSPPPPLPPTSHNHHLPRPHNRLQPSHSDNPALPKPRVKESDRAQSSEPHSVRGGRKPGPPKPPLPFHQSHGADSSHVTETQVRMLMQHWYRPKISREEAISHVLPLTAGSFIVRDSSTVKGGYALTLKITEIMVRHRKKMAPEDSVTEDMLVTHFLIQPDPQGVKLQGWSEKPFKSLPAFITSHVQEKMCLPCKLVLPDPSAAAATSSGSVHGMRRQPSVVSKALQSGASCELIYLGSVDVPSAGSDSLLAKTVQQLQGLDLSTMNIVTITVSRDGITLHEDLNGSLLKRQYPFNLITYCGLDPNTRWNFPNLHHKGETISLSDKLCFGLVHRPQNMFGFSCMVFAEYSSGQPVSSVVNFIQKMMREHRQSNKFRS